jgi:hypothetical protein
MIKDTKIQSVTIRMTWKQSESLRKSAEANNLNMSDYIRQFIPNLKGGNK